MEDYNILIPTHGRPQLVMSKTLKFLENHNIDIKEKVILFVNEEEKHDYKYLENFVNKIHYHNWGNNIGFIRNNMESPCKFSVCMDDDIQDIQYQGLPIENFKDLIEKAYNGLIENNLYLAGVNAIHNWFFMKNSNEVTTNLKYICGALYFELKHPTEERVKRALPRHGEDFEYTIKVFNRDKGVLRFNHYGIKTKYFGSGGINLSYGGMVQRQLAMETACKYIVDKYPRMAFLKKKKYGYDIGLNWRYKA